MDVAKLKRKRMNLRTKIRQLYDKGENVKELVYKYHEILNELQQLGVKTEIKNQYLYKEYWDDKDTSTPIKKVQLPGSTWGLQQVELKEPESIKPVQDSFILCLAWSASLANDTPEQVTKVMDYFKELGLPVIDESVGEIESRMEHVMRYEFKGTEESFRMLKMCTQFVLDAFAKTDFEKFNIAIYGKKKKY